MLSITPMAITSSKRKTDSGYIVFFDLDHTLTWEVSGRLIAIEAFRRNLLPPSTLFKALFLQIFFKLKLLNPVAIMHEMTRWMKDLPEEILVEICEDIVRKSILPSIFPEAVNELKKHKSMGAFTVLLSSTIRPVCEAVSRGLDIDDILCTELEISDRRFTGRPDGGFCYGAGKAEKMRFYCEKNNRSLQSAWYYGDSLSDLPVFRIVGNPVCVNPGEKLKKLANAEGWIINYWHKKGK
ncbi:MAG: HAD-IB family hydrolase [Bacteroidales bacterium]|nr:HAD-IB family hydrolase [Bacteroidales bacterium]